MILPLSNDSDVQKKLAKACVAYVVTMAYNQVKDYIALNSAE